MRDQGTLTSKEGVADAANLTVQRVNEK
jgi:hypothetical protein